METMKEITKDIQQHRPAEIIERLIKKEISLITAGNFGRGENTVL